MTVVLLAGGLACYSQTAGELRPTNAESHGAVDEQGHLGVQFFPLELAWLIRSRTSAGESGAIRSAGVGGAAGAFTR